LLEIQMRKFPSIQLLSRTLWMSDQGRRQSGEIDVEKSARGPRVWSLGPDSLPMATKGNTP
jgi:hypothetical protein